MAQSTSKKKVSEITPSEPKTANEMREWYEKHKRHIEGYAAAEQAAKGLRDVTKTNTKAVTASPLMSVTRLWESPSIHPGSQLKALDGRGVLGHSQGAAHTGLPGRAGRPAAQVLRPLIPASKEAPLDLS